MKLAIAGKGGSGKTSISGTMARLLARDGYRVLAIDGDSNPNLALTLGVPATEMSAMPTVPRELVRRSESGSVLTRTLEEVTASHSVTAPDGVTLLVMVQPEHAGVGCHCSGHAAVRGLIDAAPDGDHDVTILDTEATPEFLSRGTPRHADALYAVVEPYFKSLETGRRMAALGQDLGIARVALVANKVRDEADLAAVTEFAANHDLEIAAVIPWDAAMPAAERAAAAPLDHAPESEAVKAIGAFARAVVG